MLHKDEIVAQITLNPEEKIGDRMTFMSDNFSNRASKHITDTKNRQHWLDDAEKRVLWGKSWAYISGHCQRMILFLQGQSLNLF